MKFLFILLFIFACNKSELQNLKLQKTKQKPENTAVKNFNIKKYFGKWYEIAKFEGHGFQEECVTAVFTYGEIPNGMSFYKECFNEAGKRIKDAHAKGYLKRAGEGEFVVFLYSVIKLQYKVLYVDELYENAVIEAQNGKYLWLISKHKKPSQSKIKKMVQIAKSMGFEPSKLTFNKY